MCSNSDEVSSYVFHFEEVAATGSVTEEVIDTESITEEVVKTKSVAEEVSELVTEQVAEEATESTTEEATESATEEEIETVVENEIVTEEAAKGVSVKEEQFCASECDWLPPGQEEVTEFECYEGDYVPMDCFNWKCKLERSIKC